MCTLFADAPEIKLMGMPEGDLEENQNTVTLRCVVDANPPAQILWKKSGGAQVFGYQVRALPKIRETVVCSVKHLSGGCAGSQIMICSPLQPNRKGAGISVICRWKAYVHTGSAPQTSGQSDHTFQGYRDFSEKKV